MTAAKSSASTSCDLAWVTTTSRVEDLPASSRSLRRSSNLDLVRTAIPQAHLSRTAKYLSATARDIQQPSQLLVTQQADLVQTIGSPSMLATPGRYCTTSPFLRAFAGNVTQAVPIAI